MLDWPVATCDVIASCARAAVGADGYAGSQIIGWLERQKGRRFIARRCSGKDAVFPVEGGCQGKKFHRCLNELYSTVCEINLLNTKAYI